MIKNERLRKLVSWLAIIMLVAGVYLLSMDILIGYNQQSEVAQLVAVKQQTRQMDDVGVDATAILQSKFFHEQLLKINADYLGWIYLPGLKIDYPMVKAKNNSYYLSHSFYKKRSKRGTVFVDFRNQELFNELHLVIYGHHMRDNSMFGYLDTLRDPDNYETNKFVEIYTNQGLKKYIIFSVYPVDATVTTLDLPFEGDVDELIVDYVAKSLYMTGVDTSNADQVLTLVSCTSLVSNGRILVHAIPYEAP